MKVIEFVNAYKSKKFITIKNGVDERVEYLRKELEIKAYIPFTTKRQIAEMIVAQYTTEDDGIKKYDSISAYVGFVTAMISAHTNLEFSEDPIADYDLLAESGLLPQIVAEFKESYDECDIVLKMALSMVLEDNNINVLVGKFLNGVLKKLDVVADGFKDALEDVDMKGLLGADFKEEDLTKLSGLINKLK